MVEKAEKAGCTALFITCDAPQLGNREKDKRNKVFTYSLAGQCDCVWSRLLRARLCIPTTTSRIARKECRMRSLHSSTRRSVGTILYGSGRKHSASFLSIPYAFHSRKLHAVVLTFTQHFHPHTLFICMCEINARACSQRSAQVYHEDEDCAERDSNCRRCTPRC